MTNQEIFESISKDVAEMKKLFGEINEKLDRNEPQPELKNSLPEIINKIDETDKKFMRRMHYALSSALLVTALLTVLSFNFLVPAFSFCIGLFTVFLGVEVWVFLDEFLWQGNTLKRMSKNAVSIGLACVAIAILYSTGVELGNSWLANSYANEQSSGNNVIQLPYDKPDTASRSMDVIFPRRSGGSEGEQ